MTAMLEFDVEAARQVEAVYLTADVVQQRREVVRLLALAAGEAVLDIGSGPGLLATDLARAVGSTGRVCGIDVSDSMLALARGRAVLAGSAPVEYRHGGVDAVPYPDGSFDAAVSTQVLEYVADIRAALAEALRVLRPGGRMLVLDTDWSSIVWHSTDPERMRRILLTWEQHLADPFLPRTLGRQLRRAGFDVAPPQVLTLLNVGYEAATYSGQLIPIVARFVTGRDGWTAADVDGWVEDLQTLGPDSFFSLNRYVFCATKPQ
ncbi:methyltransferase domain-containing protein [Actinoplanes sp. NPDC051513]|uniref:methyltransferase domain-containing protein n=1 Tax=Actinoplanes sp. NPDC051513 TaxID=3363908 RepID=UPI0037B44C62